MADALAPHLGESTCEGDETDDENDEDESGDEEEDVDDEEDEEEEDDNRMCRRKSTRWRRSIFQFVSQIRPITELIRTYRECGSSVFEEFNWQVQIELKKTVLYHRTTILVMVFGYHESM